MSRRDVVPPFGFEDLPIRGALIQLESTRRRMLEGHACRRPVMETLGHSAAARAGSR